MDELKKQRLNHLSFYIKRLLNNLTYDPIIRQMEKHRVSSSYTVERLIELFTSFIDKEREEYISIISREIINAKNSKKSIWEVLKKEMNSNEQKTESAYERSNQLRHQLNSIQTIADSNQWKIENEKESSIRKISEIQNTLSFYAPFVNEIYLTVSSIKDGLISIRSDVKTIQCQFEKYLRDTNVTFIDKVYNQYTLYKDQIVNQMKQKEININCSNQKLKSSKIDILSHINNKYQNNHILLTTNSSNGEFIHALKEICCPFPLDSEYRKASYIKNKIEDRCNMIENEWRLKILKQQKKIKRLRTELSKAENRLSQLLQAESCIDFRLLEELENEHRSYMTNTRNRTDNLMRMVLNQSSLTMINDESELDLPFSDITSQ